jgi:hypothetical protein
VVDLLVWLGQALWQVALDLLPVRRLLHRYPRRSRRQHPRPGWLAPLAVGALFAALFTLANPVLARWVSSAWSSLPSWAFDPLRICIWLLLGLGAWWLLRGRRWVPPQLAVAAKAPRGDAAGARRALAVCNAVFALRLALDGVFLVAHAALPAGMSYADYAHRGAYTLVATALLAGGFVLWWFRAGSAAADPWARRLLVAWVAQNVLLAASLLRLDLYVDVYGLSRWRVAAGVWMVLVACGLALVLWRVLAQRGNAWLIDANLRVLAAVLALCAAWDIDGTIAWHNVRQAVDHSEEDERGETLVFDVGYLAGLGPAALPVLRWCARHDGSAATAAHCAALRLDQELAARLHDWRAWTFRRWRWQAEPAGK